MKQVSLVQPSESRNFTADSTSPEAQAGNITLDADNNLTIDNSSIWNELEAEAIGNAGDINLIAGSIDITQ